MASPRTSPRRGPPTTPWRKDYAGLAPRLLDAWPLGRALIGALADHVRTESGLPVADLGCGPGHVTALLDSCGVEAFGIDLSPRMVEIARRRHPGIRFDVGTMTALDVPDGVLGGVVAYWSLFHIPPAELPGVFAEFARVLAPGGHVLAGFHVGDRRLTPERAYGHPVSYDAWLLRPEHVTTLLGAAGLTVTTHVLTEGKQYPQACLWARKDGTTAPPAVPDPRD